MLTILAKISVTLLAQVVCGGVFYWYGLSIEGWESFWARFFCGMWVLSITDELGWTKKRLGKSVLPESE